MMTGLGEGHAPSSVQLRENNVMETHHTAGAFKDTLTSQLFNWLLSIGCSTVPSTDNGQISSVAVSLNAPPGGFRKWLLLK